MCEVVAHVVAAEGQHGHGIAAKLSDFSGGGRGGLAAGGGAEEGAVLPVEGFGHERNDAGTASAEEDGVNRNALGIFPLFRDGRALLRRRGEAGVGMRGLASALGRPRTAQPIHQVRRLGVGHAFPPDIAIGRKGDVGEDGVLGRRQHGIGVRLHARARRHAEEPGLGIDRVQAAVGAEFHPGNVVAHGLDFPAGDGRDEHGEVGLAAGRREGASDELRLALGVGELEDEHVLGHPAFVARLYRGDAQGVALLAQQGVAAVTGAVRPNLARVGEVADVLLLRVAGPGGVGIIGAERRADRVQAFHEFAVASHYVQDFLSDAGHDVHVGDDVGGIGDFDADLGDGRADRAHAVRDDVHGAAGHGAGVELVQDLPHLVGRLPVVGRAGILLVLGADEGAVLDAGDVGGIGAHENAVGALLGIHGDGGAGLDHQAAHLLVFVGGTVADVDLVGLAEFCDFLDPSGQRAVLNGATGGSDRLGNFGCGHDGVSSIKAGYEPSIVKLRPGARCAGGHIYW